MKHLFAPSIGKWLFVMLLCGAGALLMGQQITRVEYFFDQDPGLGMGNVLPFTTGADVQIANYGVDLANVPAGIHLFYVRARDASGAWSVSVPFQFLKGIVPAPPAAAAPNVTRMEYFVDTDPGFGLGTAIPITPGTEADVSSYAIDLNTLLPAVPAGIHLLYVRARDASGAWSVSVPFQFLKGIVPAPPAAAAPNVTRMEYFVDTDPGFGLGTAIPITPGTEAGVSSYAIDLNTLLPAVPAGIHLLYVRARDASGAWSVSVPFQFLKGIVPAPPAAAAPNVTRMEYFVDTDPGFGLGTAIPITPGTEAGVSSYAIDLNALLPAVNSGVHQLYVRTQDANGAWSISGFCLFLRGGTPAPPPAPAPDIVALEYFINTDPGFGNGTPVDVPDGPDQQAFLIPINFADLPPGDNIVYLRSKDSQGRWSLTDSTLYAAPLADIGVSGILSPVSGCELASAQAVTVTVANFGGIPQTGFDIAYTLNGGPAVTETVTTNGLNNIGDIVTYTFQLSPDLSATGPYHIEVYTILAGDAHPENDKRVADIENRSIIAETALSTCGTAPVALTATGAGAWSGGAGAFGSTTDPATTYTPDVSEIGTTVTLTRTVSAPSPCPGATDQIALTVNPGPLGSNGSLAICNGATLNYSLQSRISNGMPSDFSWTVANNLNVTGETGGSGDFIAQTLVNTSTSVQTVTYTVTPTAEGANCAGGPFTVTVTVQPQPLIAFTATTPRGAGAKTNYGGPASLDAQLCNGDQLTLSGFNRNLGTVGLLEKRTSSGNISGIPADEPEADIPPGSAAAALAGTFGPYTLASGNSGSLTRVYTPYVDLDGNDQYDAGADCLGDALTLHISLHLAPGAQAVSSQIVCSGQPLALAVENPDGLGAVFDWTAVYFSGLQGGAGYANDVPYGPTAINETLENPMPFPLAAQYTITPRGVPPAYCPGGILMVEVTVKPRPGVADQTATVCSGAPIGLTLGDDPDGPGAVSYTLVSIQANGLTASAGNPAPGAGLPASVLADDAWTNATGAPVQVVYTVAPVSAEGCAGQFTVTVTILPQPVGKATPATQTVCAGTALTPIVLSTENNLSGTTFSWTRDNTANVTGLPNSGSGNIGGTPRNLGVANEVVNYSITPTSAAGCAGAPFSAQLTVKPEPLGTATPATQTLCSDASITPIAFTTSNNLSGTTFAWTRNNTVNVTGLPNSGSGNPAGTPNNKTGSDQTVAYTITPTAGNGCAGAPFAADLVVKSEPRGQNAAVATCPGIALNISLQEYILNGQAANFNWTVADNPNVTGEANGSGDVIAQTLTNASGVDQTVTYTVTPVDEGSGCVGDAFGVKVTVKAAVIAYAGPDKSTCSTSPVALAATGTGTWSGGSGSFSNVNSPTATYTPVVSEIGTAVILTWTVAAIPPCLSASDQMIVTITTNAAVSADAGADQITCGTAPVTLSATGTGTWSGGAGVFSSKTNPTATYTPTVAEIGNVVTLTWTVSGGSCQNGTDMMFVIVNTPTTANAGPDKSTCGTAPVTLAATGLGIWSGGSGTFSSTGSPTATYTPAATEVGTTVTLTWTVAGIAPCTAKSDPMLVTVRTPPTANAGPDKITCGTTAVALAATGTGKWSGGTGVYSNKNSPTSTYKPAAAEVGTVVTLTWTVTGLAPCPNATDMMTVTVNTPTTANAGPDKTTCETTPVALTAMGTGSWSGGAGTFSSTTSPTATYTPAASEVGKTVTLTWTVAGIAPCVGASDKVLVTSAIPSDAGPDQTTCGTTPVTLAAKGAGIWSGGQGTFSSTSSPTATYTPAESETGSTIILTWTLSGSSICPGASDQVAVVVNTSPAAYAGTDQMACGATPVTLAAAGIGAWSGGAGIFSSSTDPSATYTPDPSEVGSAFSLTWTVAGIAPCPDAADQVTVNFTGIVQPGVAPILSHAIPIGGPVPDQNHKKIVVKNDGAGNYYVAGYFSGTIDFDPGVGVLNLSAVGSTDIYLSKFDAKGHLVYARRIGGSAPNGTNPETLSAFDVDDSGNVYITGAASEWLHFDSGTGSQSTYGAIRLFFAKYNDSGNLIYVKEIRGVSTDDPVFQAVDKYGNLYLLGTFQTTADFDPGSGVANLSTARQIKFQGQTFNQTSQDVFFAKYDANGNYLFAKDFGDKGEDNAKMMIIDNEDNIYLTYQVGNFSIFGQSGGGGYVSGKFNPSGNMLRSNVYNHEAGTKGVAVDGSGKIYDTGSSKYSLSGGISSTDKNIYINKTNEWRYPITPVFTKWIGGQNDDWVESIAVDSLGNIYLTGSFSGTADFDPGSGTANLTSSGSQDIFIAKYDSSGNYIYANSLGSVGDDQGASLAIDKTGRIYVAGYFQQTVDFDPGALKTEFSSATQAGFVAVYDHQVTPPTILSFSPAAGPIGTSVIIKGRHFHACLADNIVYFGAVQATVTAGSTTSLTVTVPAGATYQPITVLNSETGLSASSIQPFMVTFACGTSVFSTASFDPKADATTGSGSSSVSIGDLDGDGKLDLALANANANTVSILRNTSNNVAIAFASKVDFVAGNKPVCVAIGDLDGDGMPDLAVANENAGTVSVYRNTSGNGLLTFDPKVDVTTGVHPKSVAISDLDGDGKLDMAVANAGSATVSVFKNTGNPGLVSFAAKVDFGTASNPGNVVIGDLDGNSRPDLVVVNQVSATISIFKNISSIGVVAFAPAVSFSTGVSPVGVAIGDLDSDGKPDLSVSNQGSNTLSFFRNTASSGLISFAAKVDIATGNSPNGVSISDLNGDGKSDMAVVNTTDNTVSVFKNNCAIGTMTFAPGVSLGTGIHPAGVALGDMDSDGKPDLLTANSDDASVSILKNQTNAGGSCVEIDVLGNHISIMNGDVSPSLADGTDFGTTGITMSPIKQTFSIQNRGNSVLIITGISLSGTDAAFFTLQNLSYPFSIPGGSEATFTVTLNTNISGFGGYKQATISIVNSDSDESAYTFKIWGQGIVCTYLGAGYGIPSYTTRWTNNSGDGRWSNPANWSGEVPNAASVVFFSCPGASDAYLDINTTIGKLIIDPSYPATLHLGTKTLTLTAELTVPVASQLDAGTSLVIFGGSLWAGSTPPSVKVNIAAALYNLEVSANSNIAINQHLNVIHNLTLTSVLSLNSNGAPSLLCTTGSIKVKGNLTNNDPDGWIAGGCNFWAYVSLVGNGDQTLSGTGKWANLDISKPSGNVLMATNIDFVSGATLAGFSPSVSMVNHPGRLRALGDMTFNCLGMVDDVELLGNGNITLYQHLNVNDSLILTSVNTLGNCGEGNIKVKGHVINNDANGWAAGSCGKWAAVSLVGSGDQTMDGPGLWGSIDISKPSGNVLMNSNINFGNYSILSGTATGNLLNNPGHLRVLGSITFNYAGMVDDVELVNSLITLEQHLNVNDSLIITKLSQIKNPKAIDNIRVKGHIINNDADGWYSWGACISLVGSGNQMLSGTGQWSNMDISKPSGNVYMTSNINFTNDSRLTGTATANMMSSPGHLRTLGNMSFNYAGTVDDLELLGNGNITLTGDLNIANTLTLTSVNIISGGALRVSGTVVTNDANGWTATPPAAASFISLTGATDQTISGPGLLYLLNINKPAGNVLLPDNLDLQSGGQLTGSGLIDNTGGVFNTKGNATFNFSGQIKDLRLVTAAATITLNQDLQVANSLTLDVGSSLTLVAAPAGKQLKVNGNLSTGVTNWGSTTNAFISLAGSTDQTISGPGLLYLLDVNKPAGNVLMPDNLDLQNGGKLTGGGFIDNTGGVFNTNGNATFNFSGAIEDLKLTTNGGTRTVTLNQDLQVSNTLTLAGAGAGFWMTASPAGKKLKVGGNVSTEVFSWNTSTNAFISLTGSADQTIQTVGSGSLFKLDVNKTGGNVLMPADIWLYLNGELTGSGFFDNTGGVFRTLSGATFNFDGSIEDLRLAANNAIVTLKQDLQVNNSLTIDATPSGPFTLNASPAGKVLKVNGNVTTSATNWSTGTSNNAYISLRGSSNQTVSGTGKLHRFDFAKPAGNAVFSTASVKTFGAAATVSAGSWDLLGNTFVCTGDFKAAGGWFAGSGTLQGNVTCAAGGGIAPGAPVGCMTVKGNLVFQTGAACAVNLAALSPACTQFDQLTVTGNIQYAGALQAAFGYTPTPGSTYKIAQVSGSKAGVFGSLSVSPANIACSFAPATGILTVTGVNLDGDGAADRAAADAGLPADTTGTINLLLAPNPASGQVRIRLAGESPYPAFLGLYDSAGRLVWQHNLDAVRNDELHIDLGKTGIRAGVYAVVLRMDSARVAKRLVVLE